MRSKPWLLIFVLLLLFSCSSESTEPSDNAIQTAIIQTEAAKPSDNAIQTAIVQTEAAEPADTIAPTETRGPTNTPIPVIPTNTTDFSTAAEAASDPLVSQALTLLKDLDSAIDNMGEFSKFVTDNPTLIIPVTPKDFYNDVTLEVEDIYAVCEEIEGLTVPLLYEPAFDEVETACGYYELGGSDMLIALVNPILYAKSFEDAATGMWLGNIHMSNAAELLP